MPDLDSLLADLAAEGDSLDALVAPLPAARWADPTPAEGWTIAHQISHLAWTDEQAVVAATDGAAFGRLLEQALADPAGYVEAGAAEGAGEDPARLLARWRGVIGRASCREAVQRPASPWTRLLTHPTN